MTPDAQVLTLLRQNFRMKISQISKETKIPTSTVSDCIDRIKASYSLEEKTEREWNVYALQYGEVIREARLTADDQYSAICIFSREYPIDLPNVRIKARRVK